MLLSVSDLTVKYKNVKAIERVSIEVEEGAIVALIGSNGAGKSTLLRTVSGLKHPSSGEIWFKGSRIDKLPPTDIVRRGIAHVPEGRRVFPYMTVEENLMMGAFFRSARREVETDLRRISDFFPRLGERSKQQAGTLSGGEQQMLAVGRALMSKPTLLLMDEPSLGLAPILVAEVGRIIKDINSSGTTIVLVEQNARMALRLAGKGYVLETGSVALAGRADELMRDERVKRTYLGG